MILISLSCFLQVLCTVLESLPKVSLESKTFLYLWWYNNGPGASGARDDLIAGVICVVSCMIRDVPFCFSRLRREWSYFREPLPCHGLQSSTHRLQLSSQVSFHSSTHSHSATVMQRRYFGGMVGKWQSRTLQTAFYFIVVGFLFCFFGFFFLFVLIGVFLSCLPFPFWYYFLRRSCSAVVFWRLSTLEAVGTANKK